MQKNEILPASRKLKNTNKQAHEVNVIFPGSRKHSMLQTEWKQKQKQQPFWNNSIPMRLP